MHTALREWPIFYFLLGDAHHQFTSDGKVSQNQKNSMAGFDQSGGWEKNKNHFLVYLHEEEVDTEADAKCVEMTTIDGSTQASVAKMKDPKYKK